MKRTLLLIGAICMLLAPAIAMAGVVGSAHDLVAQMGYASNLSKQGTCSFCHVPHKAADGGDRLFPSAATAPVGFAWASDNLANICWYCHGSGTTLNGAAEVMPFQNTTHLRAANKITAGGNLLHPSAPQSLDLPDIATMPPQTEIDLVAGDLRCVSCHDVHNNSKKPFLLWGVAGDYSGAAATGFCGKCHAARNSTATGTANTGGMHPSRTVYAQIADAPLLAAAALPTIANIPMISLTTYVGGKWNLGGHSLWTGTTNNNTMVCGSCHAVHGNETATYASLTDGSTLVTAPITLPSGIALLIASENPPGTTGTEVICSQCHSIVAGKGTRGPGAAGTLSHPLGTTSTTANTIATALRGYKWYNNGTDQVLLCESCHDLHFANSNNNTWTYDVGIYCLASSCVGCHEVAGLTNHHPSGITVAAGGFYANTISTTVDWINRTRSVVTANTYGLPGLMDCTTCHGRGAAGAHNNTAWPALSGSVTESQMCVDCHGFNPSMYTTLGNNLNTQWGTHFVGSISTAAYKRTAAWANTNYTSKFGAQGTAGTIICESCHSLKVSGLGTPVHNLTYALANNSTDSIPTTKDSIELMVQRSGNSASVTDGTLYLCTGCHGNSPGGTTGNSTSHPTQPLYQTLTVLAAPAPTSYTGGHGAGSNINCESCHRPHDAFSLSGTTFTGHNYILESATAATGYINTSGLCNVCHTNY